MAGSSCAAAQPESAAAGAAGRHPGHAGLGIRSDEGFLLLDAARKPISVNAAATKILLYPEEPRRTMDLANQVASAIHAMVANGGSNGRVSACKEFLSGRRHYICRFFDLRLQGNNSNGSNGSSLALVLERSPGAAVDTLKICHQYHLSRREAEAVRLLLQGLASKDIAARMEISPNTVKVFLRLAMMKMGVSSRSGIMSKFINPKTSDRG